MRITGAFNYGVGGVTTHSEPFDVRFPAMNMWVVYKRYETGKIERVAAFFSEDSARKRAAELVGKDLALVGLETIPVEDRPACDHEWAGMQHPEGGLARRCKKCGHEDRTW